MSAHKAKPYIDELKRLIGRRDVLNMIPNGNTVTIVLGNEPPIERRTATAVAHNAIHQMIRSQSPQGMVRAFATADAVVEQDGMNLFVTGVDSSNGVLFAVDLVFSVSLGTFTPIGVGRYLPLNIGPGVKILGSKGNRSQIFIYNSRQRKIYCWYTDSNTMASIPGMYDDVRGFAIHPATGAYYVADVKQAEPNHVIIRKADPASKTITEEGYFHSDYSPTFDGRMFSFALSNGKFKLIVSSGDGAIFVNSSDLEDPSIITMRNMFKLTKSATFKKAFMFNKNGEVALFLEPWGPGNIMISSMLATTVRWDERKSILNTSSGIAMDSDPVMMSTMNIHRDKTV